MKPNLVIATLIKNEANRFLPSALEAWQRFADRIVVLDDGSTDGTPELAEEAGAFVYHRGEGVSAWGAEAPARAELWERALDESRPGDYIFILDADMVPLRDPAPLLQISPDTVCFVLYDLWAPRAFRQDGYWTAHLTQRPWLVKRPEETPKNGWLWPSRGIHTGHFPTNLSRGRTLLAPADFGLLHYAYSSKELREEKAAAYTSLHEQLTSFERAHADSILDPHPVLEPLRYEPSFPLQRTPLHASPTDSLDHERPGGDPEAPPSDYPVAVSSL